MQIVHFQRVQICDNWSLELEIRGFIYSNDKKENKYHERVYKQQILTF
jgi:hypothetical protein